MRQQSKVITTFILVFLVVVFSVINTESVNLSFGFAKIKSPLVFVILGSTILGALIVFITWFSSYWKQRKDIKQLKKQLSEFEEAFTLKVTAGIADERSVLEQELSQKQARIDELEQEFKELKGELFLDNPESVDHYFVD